MWGKIMSFVKLERRRTKNPRKGVAHDYAVVPAAGGKDLAILDDEMDALRMVDLINLGYSRGIEAGRQEHAAELRALLSEGVPEVEPPAAPKMHHRFTYQGQDADIPDEFRVEMVIPTDDKGYFIFKDSATGEIVATVEHETSVHRMSGWYVFQNGVAINQGTFNHAINAIRWAAQELI